MVLPGDAQHTAKFGCADSSSIIAASLIASGSCAQDKENPHAEPIDYTNPRKRQANHWSSRRSRQPMLIDLTAYRMRENGRSGVIEAGKEPKTWPRMAASLLAKAGPGLPSRLGWDLNGTRSRNRRSPDAAHLRRAADFRGAPTPGPSRRPRAPQGARSSAGSANNPGQREQESRRRWSRQERFRGCCGHRAADATRQCPQ